MLKTVWKTPLRKACISNIHDNWCEYVTTLLHDTSRHWIQTALLGWSFVDKVGHLVDCERTEICERWHDTYFNARRWCSCSRRFDSVNLVDKEFCHGTGCMWIQHRLGWLQQITLSTYCSATKIPTPLSPFSYPFQKNL